MDQPQTLFDRLQATAPARNILAIAVETLTTPEQVQQFIPEYVALLSRHDLMGRKPEAVALSTIGYVLGYYWPEQHALWRGTWPAIRGIGPAALTCAPGTAE